MKIAFVYPGQGAQKVGMANDIIEQFPEAKHIIQQANQQLDFDLEELISTDSENRLNETRYTQPALVAVSTAIGAVVESIKIQPNYVAGLSLGEYAALVKAESLSFEEAIHLIDRRAIYMQEAALENPGAMAAVLGLEDHIIKEICEQLTKAGQMVAPSNFNMPGQTVIGGTKEAIVAAQGLLVEAGAKRVIELPVSGAFHTSFMERAAQRLALDLATVKWQEPKIATLNNNTNQEHKKDLIAMRLQEQVTHPVYWKENITYMLEHGVTIFIEIGPGKTLSQMIKKIAQQQGVDVVTLQTDSVQNIEKLKAFFSDEKENKDGIKK